MEKSNTEIWKDVVGYEGYYLVSNKGNVKSVDRKVGNRGHTTTLMRGKPKKKTKLKIGYFVVSLWKNNKSRLEYVHRLVATAYLENPNNYAYINHKDGVKTNNDVENLEWCTQQDNVQHSVRTGLSKYPRIMCVETSEIFVSASEAYRITGIYQTAISACVRGVRHTAGGFHWIALHPGKGVRYKPEYP